MASRRSGGARQAQGGVGKQRAPVGFRAPLADQDQGVVAVGTTQASGGLGSAGLGNGSRAGSLGLDRRLPGGLFGD